MGLKDPLWDMILVRLGPFPVCTGDPKQNRIIGPSKHKFAYLCSRDRSLFVAQVKAEEKEKRLSKLFFWVALLFDISVSPSQRLSIIFLIALHWLGSYVFIVHRAG